MGEKLRLVVDAIISKKVTATANSLVLPEGLRWPCATNNVLFVRKYYDPLYTHVLKGMREQINLADNLQIVTGQPGIGKSVFGMYVLYRLLTDEGREGVKIAYLHQGLENKVLIISRDGSVVSVERSEVPQFHDMVMICDTVTPLLLTSPSLWISSAGALDKKENQESLNRFSLARMYMPLPDLEECLQMNQVAFRQEGITASSVRARVNLWGAVPRLLFYYNTAVEQRAAANTIKSLDAAQIRQAFDDIHRSAGDGQNPSHRLFLERTAGQDEDLDEESLSEAIKRKPF